MRAFLKAVCGGSKRCPGRGAVTRAFDELATRCATQVTETMQAAKAAGNHITLTADAWKNKGKKRRHYHCIFASWMDEQWVLQDVCIGVVELCAPRNWQAYKASVTEVLERVGLKPSDIFAAVTDHDGTIRKGFKACGFTLVGCCCHGLQLPIQHVLPPMHAKKKQKKKQAAPAESSSSSSSSDSDSGSSAVAEPPEKKQRRPPLEDTDPERVQLTRI